MIYFGSWKSDIRLFLFWWKENFNDIFRILQIRHSLIFLFYYFYYLLFFIFFLISGIPDIDSFLSFVQNIDDLNVSNGPLVVHCSAGVGRTAVFICVHMTLANFKWQKSTTDKPVINIPKTILKMRENRTGMVGFNKPGGSFFF